MELWFLNLIVCKTYRKKGKSNPIVSKEDEVFALNSFRNKPVDYSPEN